MSSISALQNVALDTVSPAKPVIDTVSAASTSSAASAAVAQSAASSYPSPVFSLDAGSNRVIFEYRNASSGQIVEQLPSKDAIRLYEIGAGRPAQAPVKPAIST